METSTRRREAVVYNRRWGDTNPIWSDREGPFDESAFYSSRGFDYAPGSAQVRIGGLFPGDFHDAGALLGLFCGIATAKCIQTGLV